MATKIKLRRDNNTNWSNANPILALGEPGYETDTNKIKIGDGITPWNDLIYANDGGTQKQFVASFSGYPTLANTVSDDGNSWTFAQSNTWHTNSGYTNIDVYISAIGNGVIVYLAFDYNVGQTTIWYAETANQAITKIDSPTILGPNGEAVNWQSIQFANGYFVAVGNYHDTVRNNYDYPAFAYSKDGKTWSWGSVDLNYIQNLIVNCGLGYENAIYFEDVASNGTGWAFFSQWDYYYASHSYGSGVWYITDLTATLNASNYSNTLPGSRRGFHENTGWVAWDNYTGHVYFNTNNNPLFGSWTTLTYSDIISQSFGNVYSCLQYATAGKLHDGDYFALFGSDGRVSFTKDGGVTWAGSVVNPYTSAIAAVDKNNPALIEINSGNYQWWNYNDGYAEKITISGAVGISGNPLNGTYYVVQVGNANNNYIYELYHDAAKTQPVDATGWSGTYTANSATVTWTHGTSINHVVYGDQTILVQSNSLLYNTKNLFNWTSNFATYGWNGPWGFATVSYGEIGTHSGLLRSRSTRIPGVTNSLSLGDDFSVELIGGDPVSLGMGAYVGYNYLNMQPANNGYWELGGGTYYGNTVGIYAYNWNQSYDSLALYTWNNTWYFVNTDSDFNNLPTIRIPSNSDVVDENSLSYFKDTPQNNNNGNYTLVYNDRGKHVYYNGGSTATYSVPTHNSVAFPIGTTITLVTGQSSILNIAAVNNGTTTIRVSGIANTPAGYTIAETTVVTLLKVESELWILSGNNITAL